MGCVGKALAPQEFPEVYIPELGQQVLDELGFEDCIAFRLVDHLDDVGEVLSSFEEQADVEHSKHHFG